MTHKNKIFTEVEIKGEDFDEDTFAGCKFTELNFKFVTFKNCTFKVCDFSGSFFDSTSFTKCEFVDCKLISLDFADCGLANCNFKDCLMTNCIFQKLKSGQKGEKQKVSLVGCDFAGNNLEGSVFVLCDLGVSFQKADLDAVVFEKCNLTKADLRQANIMGANFESSKVSQSKLDINGILSFASSKGFTLDE